MPAFALPAALPASPSSRAVTLNDGGAAVVAVSAVRTGTRGRTTGARWRRAREESQRLGTVRTEMAYVEEVRRAAEVRKNPKAFD